MGKSAYLLAILFFFCSYNTDGRDYKNKICVSPYTFNFFGKSTDISYKWHNNRHEYYAGLGVLINPPKRSIQSNAALYNKAYATTIRQRLILRCGYEHFIFNKDNMKLGTFFELTVANTKLKVESYSASLDNNTFNSDTSIIVTEYNYVDYVNSNVTFVNTNLGLDVEAPIFDRLNLECRIGISPGIALYRTYPGSSIRVSGIGGKFLFCSFSINYEL